MKPALVMLKMCYSSGTCARIIPPNVTVSYDRATDANGHYTEGTLANVSCAEGFQLYGASRVYCGLHFNSLATIGVWNEPIEQFRCIPSNQGRRFTQLN